MNKCNYYCIKHHAFTFCILTLYLCNLGQMNRRAVLPSFIALCKHVLYKLQSFCCVKHQLQQDKTIQIKLAQTTDSNKWVHLYIKIKSKNKIKHQCCQKTTKQMNNKYLQRYTRKQIKPTVSKSAVVFLYYIQVIFIFTKPSRPTTCIFYS